MVNSQARSTGFPLMQAPDPHTLVHPHNLPAQGSCAWHSGADRDSMRWSYCAVRSTPKNSLPKGNLMSDQTKRETSDETLDDVSGGMYTNPVPPHGIPPTHQPGAGHVRIDPPPPPKTHPG